MKKIQVTKKVVFIFKKTDNSKKRDLTHTFTTIFPTTRPF